MQFNPSSDKYNSIIADIDFLLFSDGENFNSSYSLADRTRNINISYDEVVEELYKADPNFKWDDLNNTNFPLATTDLISGRDHYTMLDSFMVIYQVRIKDRNGNWKTLEPKLRTEYSDGELESTGTPSSFYKISESIFPVPIPNYGYDEGLQVEFQRGSSYFTTTDTTKEPGFNEQFHQYLSINASHRYAVANSLDKKANSLLSLREQIKQDIRAHYQRRSPDDRPQMRLKPKPISTWGLS